LSTITFENTGAVMVTFHPTAATFSNIQILSKQLTELIIVDNTPHKSEALADFLKNSPQITLIQNQENWGIARSLNLGVEVALKKKLEWVFTFDQDSTPTDHFLTDIKAAYDSYPNQEKLALISPYHQSPLQNTVVSSKIFKTIDFAMTSGCLIKLSVFEMVGTFDEDLFIDYVDLDYCLRIKQKGFDLIEASCAILKHELGKAQWHTLGPLRCAPTHHSAERRYYITRNRIHCWKKYALTFPQWFFIDFKSSIKEFIKLILFEEEKRLKLYYILLGIRDALYVRLGKRVDL